MSAAILSYQFFSSRHVPSLDREIAMLAEAGYQVVEPFDGLYGDLDSLAHALHDAGRTAPSGHFGLAMLERDFARSVDVARRRGMTYVVMA